MPKNPQGKLHFLPYSKIPKYLTCPKCFKYPKSSLVYKDGILNCTKCKYRYPLRSKIAELINLKIISKQAKSELEGNEIKPTKENIKHYSQKDRWSKYYNHIVNQKISYLMNGLKNRNFKGLISLGSGPGFEIKEILKRKHFPLVFSSDIAFTATSIVSYTLNSFDTTVCLFTSDLNFSPVIPNPEFPIIIYEALHHTKNAVSTLDSLMKKKYENILFVEPCTNFLVKLLASLGLAQRTEYSGVKPDFLDLEKIEKRAKKWGYKIKINTLWDIPEEYIGKVSKRGSATEKFIQDVIDIFSIVTNLINFGSFAIVHLQLNDKQ